MKGEYLKIVLGSPIKDPIMTYYFLRLRKGIAMDN